MQIQGWVFLPSKEDTARGNGKMTFAPPAIGSVMVTRDSDPQPSDETKFHPGWKRAPQFDGEVSE